MKRHCLVEGHVLAVGDLAFHFDSIGDNRRPFKYIRRRKTSGSGDDGVDSGDALSRRQFRFELYDALLKSSEVRVIFLISFLQLSRQNLFVSLQIGNDFLGVAVFTLQLLQFLL